MADTSADEAERFRSGWMSGYAAGYSAGVLAQYVFQQAGQRVPALTASEAALEDEGKGNHD